jgi:hypothetical protein
LETQDHNLINSIRSNPVHINFHHQSPSPKHGVTFAIAVAIAIRSLQLMRVFPLTLLITFLLLCSFLKIHATDSTCSEDDETIASEYLQNHTSMRVPFRIHGWRWHTMAVLRELQILHNVLKSPLGDSSRHEDIVAAMQHTIGFNMKGLHRVETTLFYPWLTKTFDTIPDSAARLAFQRILFSVKQNQQSLIQHGSFVVRYKVKCCHWMVSNIFFLLINLILFNSLTHYSQMYFKRMQEKGS